MGLRTAEQYLEGLRDGRTVYFRGERVPDILVHPELRIGAEHTALDYRLAEDPAHRDLFTATLPETGERVSRYFVPPAGAEDLLKRREMIETSTREGEGVVLLIKEIGTDALFTLNLVARQVDARYGTGYLERVRAYHAACRDRDLSLAVAQTDVKGDRSLLPSQQTHPDYYVRIVERRPDGIVVRGAKAHTTGTAFVDEVIALPTRAISEEDRDYAVAFAVPVNTPGVKLIASPFGFTGHSRYHHPVSARHHLVETLTIFDDVFVPNERVFLAGEWDFAGVLANTFVEFHRFTAVSYKPPLLDLLIGAAALIAVYNGIEKASHIREKATRLITYAETVRALTRASAMDCKVVDGIAVPNTMTTNVAKYYFAAHYHEAVRDVQDIAGGLVVTGPSEADWHNPETRDYLDRYLGGRKGVPTMDRMKAINLIRDLTASDFGGYHELLAIHAEGSLEAQKITIFRGYDLQRCMNLARKAAGIGE
jgi:aromatic ring hydroxylase